MPRGKPYGEEIRREARELRQQGWSLKEIGDKFGAPKHTVLGWVKGIELTDEQRGRLDQKRHAASFAQNVHNSAAAANKAARLARIADAQEKAEAMLTTVRDTVQVNHIAAAMLYLGEGSRVLTTFAWPIVTPTSFATGCICSAVASQSTSQNFGSRSLSAPIKTLKRCAPFGLT